MTQQQTIRVVVKQTHIELGKPVDSEGCPVALALLEMGYQQVSVGGNSVRFNDSDGHGWFGLLPWKGYNFVTRFDEGKKENGPVQFNLVVHRVYDHVAMKVG